MHGGRVGRILVASAMTWDMSSISEECMGPVDHADLRMV